MHISKQLFLGTLFVLQLLSTSAAEPVVNWIRPTNGASFATGSSILLRASASDSDGTLNLIDFLAGTNLIGRISGPLLTNGVYSFMWSNAPAGVFQLHAEAVDNDGDRGASASVEIAISGVTNARPTLDPIVNLEISEDAGSQTVTLSGIGSGAASENQTLSVTAVSSNPSLIPNPSINYTSPNDNGSLTFRPVTNAFGIATITVSVNDGQPLSNIVTRSFIVTVVPVNDLPFISGIADRAINENTSTGPIAFTVRDVETPASSLVVSGLSDNPALIPSANLAFGGTGTNRIVTIIPALDQFGTAIITVTAQDDAGGTANRTFSVTVIDSGTNVPPTNMLPVVNWIRPTNGSTFAAGSSILLRAFATASNAPLVSLDFLAGTNLLRRFSGALTNGVYSFMWSNAPVGTHQLRAEVEDNTGGRGVSASAQIVVTNTPPTNNLPVVNLFLPTNGAVYSVGAPILLRATASDSDGALASIQFFAGPTLLRTISGALTNGVYSFLWTNAAAGMYLLRAEAVDNAGGRGVSLSVQVAVSGATNPPTSNALPVITLTRPTGGAAFALGSPILITADASVPVGTLTNIEFLANTTVIHRFPGLWTNGLFTFNWTDAPVGTHLLRAFAWDNAGALGTSAPVLITVSDTNAPPTNLVPVVNWIRPTNGAVYQSGSTILLTAQATDADGMVNYVEFFATTTNEPSVTVNLGRTSPFEISTNSHYSLFWSNAPAGSFWLQAVAGDNVGARGLSDVVQITVGDTNAPPTLNPLPNLSISEDAGNQTVLLSGIGSGAASENQTLSITALSSNPSLIPGSAITISYTSPNTNGTLTFRPVTNAFGIAVVTVIVNDGQPWQNIVTRSFSVTVDPVNDLPVISGIPNQAINKNTATGPLSFTVRDVETPASSLVLSGTSDNPVLVPAGNLVFGGSGTNRIVTVIPALNQFGTAAITVMARDAAGGTGSRVFSVVVADSGGTNSLPTNNVLPVVSWIHPTNGASFVAGSSILLTAQAADVDGAVDYVEFFATPTVQPSITVKLGRVFQAPSNSLYTLSWSNAPLGTFHLQAVAGDNVGARGYSDVVQVAVGPGPLPAIQVISVSHEIGVDLIIYGEAGRTHVVECSEDTVSWTPISSAIMPAAASMPVRDASPTTVNSRFYRVIELP